MHARWILALSLVAPAPMSAQQVTLDSADTERVTRALAEFDATGSGTGGPAAARRRSALFADHAVMINAFGIRVEGRDSLDAFWKMLYGSGSFSTSRIERISREQRVLGPRLVLVDHVERITGQRNPETRKEMPPRVAHLTVLLQKQPAGDWRIVYYRAGDVRDLPR